MYVKLPKRARSIANPMQWPLLVSLGGHKILSLTVSNLQFNQSCGCEITKDDKKKYKNTV